MKVIYIQNEKFEWNRFEYENITDLKSEIESAKIKLGYNCHLGDNCHLGYNCQLGDNCHLGYKTNIDNSRAIFILNGYKYSAGGHFNSDGVQIIQLGCYTRTRQDWESDFWNNELEFTNPESEESKARVRTYKTICFFLDRVYETDRK